MTSILGLETSRAEGRTSLGQHGPGLLQKKLGSIVLQRLAFCLQHLKIRDALKSKHRVTHGRGEGGGSVSCTTEKEMT